MIRYLHTKKTILASIHPALENGEALDISKAAEAISQYIKTVDNPSGEAELRTFFVECGNNFTLDYGDIDAIFYDSMLEMYKYAIETILELPDKEADIFKERLKTIMDSASGIGWGYHSGMCDLYHQAFST